MVGITSFKAEPAFQSPLPEGWAFTPLPAPLPIREQKWPSGTRPWVSIFTVTFQHAAFLRDTLEGFLQQKTTFPVEILVHDDASSDGAQEILKDYDSRYPNLFRLVLQRENQYSQGKKGFQILHRMALGYYGACCEGDDYWTHPEKLEWQNFVLQTHPDCALSGHASVDQRDEQNTPFFLKGAQPGMLTYFSAETGLKEALFPRTQTLFFRMSAFMPGPAFGRVLHGDRYLITHLICKGGLLYLGEAMAVYRIHPGGVYSSKNGLQRLQGTVAVVRALLNELPPRCRAAASIPYALIAVEEGRLTFKERDYKAFRGAVSHYCEAFLAALGGLRGGIGAVRLVAEATFRILLTPWTYGARVFALRLRKLRHA